jgi:phosphatidylinositol glycan class Q protein
MGGSKGDVLMRIFWPLNFPRKEQPGVLVGWRNSETDIFVVAILNGVNVRCFFFLNLFFLFFSLSS